MIKLIQTLINDVSNKHIKNTLSVSQHFWRGKFLYIQTYLNQTGGQFSLTELTFRLDCCLRYGYCEKNTVFIYKHVHKLGTYRYMYKIKHTVLSICKEINAYRDKCLVYIQNSFVERHENIHSN